MNSQVDDAGNKQQGAGPVHDKPISMHHDVPVWYDCCSCEAEPYWVEALESPESECMSQAIARTDDNKD